MSTLLTSLTKMTDETVETYEYAAQRYHERHPDTFWLKELAYFKEHVPGNKVVDIGCGTGRDAVALIREHFDYLGVDGAEGMLKIARKRVPQGEFRKLNFYELAELPAGFYDGFWAAAALLHVPKNRVVTVLKNLKNLLKEGGIGFISVKKKVGEFDEGLIKEDKYEGRGRYFSFYTMAEFAAKIDESGLLSINSWEYIEDDEDKTKWLCFFVKKESS